MNPTSPKSRFSALGYGLFGLGNLLFLIILLDSFLHREFQLYWLGAFTVLPLVALLTVFSIYSAIKTLKHPSAQVLSPKKRVAIYCFVLLYLALPVIGIWSIRNDVASCYEVKAKGSQAFATVENAELGYEHMLPRSRNADVQSPANANQLDMKLKFTAGTTVVEKYINPYFSNRDTIARIYNEAKTGTLRVQYQPKNPETFFVVAAPCQESIFAIFL